ncbi:MAG: prolyl oligopeptidase family serine peptidase [Alphaproteobacteria bacterium]|nr:prolyl oligopeptidase family serine peptidase [Alphaproteobacteria bacterium]
MRILLSLIALQLILASGAFALTDDPYAWLEDVHGEKPLAWVKQENAKALGPLKADPRYQKNYQSVLEVLDATDRIPTGGLSHGFVYNFWQNAANPKGVWRRTSIADYQTKNPKWDVLLDVDALAKEQKENWVFKGAECSPGETRCLVRLSRGGGYAVVLREYDLKARRLADDGFALPEAKIDAGYLDDDTLLFATTKDGETKSGYARIVKLWKRDAPITSAKVLYEGQVEDVLAAPATFHSKQGNAALVIRAVNFFESDYFLLAGDTVKQLPLPRSADVKGLFDGAWLATLRQPFETGGVSLPKGALVTFRDGVPPQLIFAPNARQSIESVGIGHDKVYAAITDNVIGAVHVFTTDGKGWSDRVLPLPGQGSADIVSANDFGPEALFSFQNYLTPPTHYFDDGSDKPRAIKSLPARFDGSGLVSEQFEAVSKDGTKIPYFVTRPKNLKGPAPSILYGYGGFEISLTPGYSANMGRLWLSQGGIYVVANIRGGGEFGPAWHDAALKNKRQHAYDDFEAVAADLARRGLTTPKQLGILGGSNGGLLVSTVMVQRPDLFGAVVCQVPLIDMIAYTHIGAGASWVAEYGDPAIPAERDYILTYSPYQNVKAGVKYPPVFFVTATSDDRVTPVHARKMAARMMAQGHEVLFYENTDGGHAAAADHRQNAEMWGLSFVYLAKKLGLRN